MAKTFLDGVNEVLKEVHLINGETGLLLNFTDSARQIYIDTAIQKWNQAIDDLYSISGEPKPKQLSENTITLVTGDRDYALETDMVRLHFPLMDETNGRWITEYPGGYMEIIKQQLIPSNYTGMPLMACIRPTDGELYLDRIPTSSENGLVYKYRYDRDLVLKNETDVFPFTDTVFRAMVPAVSELWKMSHNNKFSAAEYNSSIGRASRLLRQIPIRDSWLPMRTYSQPLSINNPFDD